MKHSILRRTALMLTVVLIVIMIFAAFLSYQASLRSVMEGSSLSADDVYKFTEAVIDGESVTAIFSDEESEEATYLRQSLTGMCDWVNAEYLYLFMIDQQEALRTYYMAVASNEEVDATLKEIRGYNTTVHDKLTDAVVQALHGEKGTMEIVNSQFGKTLTWYFPIEDKKGTVQAIMGIDFRYELFEDKVLRISFATIAQVGLLFIAFMLLYLWFFSRYVVRPIKKISDRMTEFAHAHVPHAEPLRIKTGDEIQEIADSFEQMTHDIATYMTDIRKMTAERAATAAEMDVARLIQRGMVPEHLSRQSNGYAMCAVCRPARAVGGDFYDFFELEDGRVCAMVGDVSGKGVSAALFMVRVRTSLRELLGMGFAPHDALNRANDSILVENAEGMFATVLVMLFDPTTGELRYANAGHTKPVLVGDEVRLLVPDPGVAIGLFEDAGIEEGRMTLEPDEQVVIYTDGVSEAVSASEAFFGEERLLETVRSLGRDERDPEHTLKAIEQAVDSFAEGCEQFDDLTVLVLGNTGGEGMWRLELDAEYSQFAKVREALRQACDNDDMFKRVTLACDEAFANIVSYSGAKMVEVTCRRVGDELAVTLSDDGVAFDPLGSSPVERDFDDYDRGGMGITLMKEVATSVEYEYKGGRNVLTLRFAL